MVENNKVPGKITGDNRCQNCQQCKKQNRSCAYGPGQDVSDISPGQKKQSQYSQNNQHTSAPNRNRSQKQSPHILHMGDLPLTEEFSGLSVHNRRHMQILTSPPQIGHHFVRYIQKILHFHLNRLQHMILAVLLLIIARRPVGDRLHRGNQQSNHQGKRARKAKQDMNPFPHIIPSSF